MRDANGVLLSVRGEASLTVPPDFAVVRGALSCTADSKADALDEVTAAQQRLTASLEGLGAVPLTVDSARSALTWSSHSLHVHPEHDYDHGKGVTGRTIASLGIELVVRELSRFTELNAALAAIAQLEIHQVSWHVDWDNPQWPGVRAAAIQAAIRKGRDYAEALGGSLERIEHVADVGLLGGDTGSSLDSAKKQSMHFGVATQHGDSPTLDPVPQEIVATIEARLVASVAPLSRSE